MEQIRCQLCGKQNENLESIKYDVGGEVHICSICHGLIEKIVEHVLREHLSFDLDAHQELSEFIKSIVESYVNQEREERF